MNLRLQRIGVIIEFVDLEADFGIFVGIEGRNTALGGAEGIFAQALLLVAVKGDMVRHDDLRTVGNNDVRLGNAAVFQLLHFLDEVFYAECNAVADDVDDVLMEHA